MVATALNFSRAAIYFQFGSRVIVAILLCAFKWLLGQCCFFIIGRYIIIQLCFNISDILYACEQFLFDLL